MFKKTTNKNKPNFSDSEKYNKLRKKLKLKKILGLSLICSAIFFIFAAALINGFITNKASQLTINSFQKSGAKKIRSSNDIINKKKPFSILLMGTDTGELGRNDKTFGEARTDTLILATVNPKKSTVTLNSIPRDSLVNIDTENSKYDPSTLFPTKINSAIEYGGIKTTINTVQKWLDVPIDFYTLVNMNGLVKLVDKVDGVKVDSPLDFTYSQDTAHDYGKHLYKFTKGSSTFQYSENGDGNWKTYTKMDGNAALAFSRMRYDDPRGDYGRQERQRLVMNALIKKAASFKTITDDKFIQSLSKTYKSDLSSNDIISIATNYNSVRKNIKNNGLEGTSVTADGQSMELISKENKDKFTNDIREQLGLSSSNGGTLFGGDTSKFTINHEEGSSLFSTTYNGDNSSSTDDTSGSTSSPGSDGSNIFNSGN